MEFLRSFVNNNNSDVIEFVNNNNSDVVYEITIAVTYFNICKYIAM